MPAGLLPPQGLALALLGLLIVARAVAARRAAAAGFPGHGVAAAHGPPLRGLRDREEHEGEQVLRERVHAPGAPLQADAVDEGPEEQAAEDDRDDHASDAPSGTSVVHWNPPWDGICAPRVKRGHAAEAEAAWAARVKRPRLGARARPRYPGGGAV